MADDYEPGVTLPITTFHNVERGEEPGTWEITLDQPLVVNDQQIHDMLTHGIQAYVFLEPCDEEELHIVAKFVLDRAKGERIGKILERPE